MKKQKKEKLIIYILLIIIFLLMFLLNRNTPIMTDDFGYSLNLDKEHLTGIKDIINFQLVHYVWWGGRLVAHSIAQFFLLLPKEIFNCLNSLVFTLLIFLIYNLSKKDKDNPIILLGIFFLLYFFVPVFGQTTLWLIGSCNYLWTTCIILLFLTFFLNETKYKKISIIFLFFFGIVAGWTNENTSVGLFSICILSMIIDKINKKKIEKRHISGLIGIGIGFLIMILAPGNFIRKDSVVDNTFILVKLLKRFLDISLGFITHLYPMLILLIVLVVLFILKKKKINKKLILFSFGTLVSIYSMILSPLFPNRAWFGITVFLIVILGNILFELDDINFKFKKQLSYILILLFLMIFIFDYKNLYFSTKELKDVWDSRIKYIETHKDEKKFTFKKYKTINKKNPNYDQLDITNNKDEWPNTDIEKYFKIEEIIGTN